ncbi:MAG: hypothetical protein HPY83_10010 [Anaerolineae bacterium]|nr:hypothetical protein [Anaerolineae bacterium]
MPTDVSFFLDDVAPYAAGLKDGSGRPLPVDGEALRNFLDYVRETKIAGAVSVIPGMFGLLSRSTDPHERGFAAVLPELVRYPVDPHMEIMTHDRLFDFGLGTVREDGPTEMEWLDDHSISVDEYRDYFRGTIAARRDLGVTYAGMTTPGTHPNMNPNVWQALLDVVEEGGFGREAVAVFAVVEPELPQSAARLMASRGRYRVFDLPSATQDFLARWVNSPELIEVDYYLTPEGEGRLADLIRSGSPTAVMHMHWQGVNPQHGVGWRPFQQVIERLNSVYSDRIRWRRPSEIVADAG